MSRWKVPVYDNANDDIIRYRLYQGVHNVFKNITIEKKRLETEVDNLEVDFDIFRDNFIEKTNKYKTVSLFQKLIQDCKTMEDYLNNHTKHFLLIKDELLKYGKEEKNSDILVETVLHFFSLEDSFENLIETFARYSIHDNYRILYKDIYLQIKRPIDWYCYDHKEKKIVLHHPLTQQEIIFNYPLVKKINIGWKPIQRAASIIVETVTGHRPDHTEEIEKE